MPSQPETIGKYRILGSLGSGGMSTVFRAHHPDLDIDVAIKLLQDDSPGNATVLRFQREARAAGRLNHQNVARVLDFGNADGKLYLVMELVPGKSLANRIKSNGALSVEEALPVFERIAAGLAHAHSNGVLHRDIKPSNIMLTEGENGEIIVKIVDFGIARLIESDDRLTISGANIGSPLYMSPEQTSAASVDERSDIYSLGCLMYECLSGEPPFRGDTALETMMMHRDESPRPLSLEYGEAGSSLERLIMQCLEKEPGDRPAGMGKLRSELERIIDESLSYDIRKPEQESGTDAGQEAAAAGSSELSALRSAMPFLVVVVIVAIAAYLGITLLETSQPREKSIQIKMTPAFSALPKLDPIRRADEGKTAILGEDASDNDIERLKSPPLSHLKIMGNGITPSGLERIARLPLTHLTLEDTIYDASSLASLKEISGLHGLCLIRNTKIDDNAIETLSTLRPFESLELNDCPVTDRGMKVIAEKLDLSSLILKDLDKVSVSGLESLKGLEKLTFLSVHLSHLEPERVGKAIASTKAVDISIIHLPVGRNELRFFSDRQVRSLLLDRAQKDAAREIGKWKALTNLTINAREFDHDDIEAIARIKTLTLLKLNDRRCTSADLEALSGSSVAGLVLENCTLDAKVLMRLVESPHLDRVEMIHCAGIAATQLEDFMKAYHKRWERSLEGRFQARTNLQDLVD